MSLQGDLSPSNTIDYADWPSSSSAPRNNSLASLDTEADSTGLLLGSPALSLYGKSKDSTNVSQSTTTDPSSESVFLPLNPSVVVSFNKGSRFFKLRYSRIEVARDYHGNLKHIGLSESHGSFVHHFPNTRHPIPHIEQPYTPSSQSTFVVSFLEPQAVTVAQTSFSAQPHYTFDSWDDCVRFQETLFNQRVLLLAGVAEVKSKGRGEECISQNLRVLQARNGRQTITFFANSQRKENKRYISVPLDSIEGIGQGKKGGPPVTLRLRANSELLGRLKTLQIEFLDDNDHKTFWAILCQGVGAYGS